MSFTEGSVDLPAVGKVKKRYVIVPAAVVVAYVGYRWYQARQDSAADAGPADSSGIYTTDDQSEMGQSTAGGTYNPTGNTGSTVTDGTNPNAIDTNAEWTARAAELLGNAGYDGTAVYAALGDFLARRALDKGEATIVRAALAAAGQPPVGGPYPVLEEAGAGTGTLPAPTNVRAYGIHSATEIGMQWDAVPGAVHYRIYRTGNSEPIGDSYDTKWQGRQLQPNTAYTFYVRAVGSTGKVGGQSSVFSAKTSPVKLGKPTGLKASAITRTSFRVTCSKVSGATYYRWYFRPPGGDWRASGASDQPYRDFTGLSPNKSYQVKVSADTTNQTPGPESSPLTVKTKR